MKFTKMHGAGNDFIIIDGRGGAVKPEEAPALAKRLCTRRTSIGADGLMLVTEPKNGGDFSMLFLNNDGTIGEMCGNGARCITRWGLEHGLSEGDEAKIETTAGIVTGKRITKTEVTVRLNTPTKIVTEMTVRDRLVSYVELGNPAIPHCVVFSDDLNELTRDELFDLGRTMRHDSAFPKGANVTFAVRMGEDRLKCVTFERGVEDFTLACGTGAGSAALALTLRGIVSGRETKLHFPGGLLKVSVRNEEEGYGLYLTGPTCVVAEGEFFEEI